MKILISDDSQTIRELIKSMLSNGSHVIYECEDGVEAVELFHTHHPDIVLMDISMKQMGGLEASQKILEKQSEAKILIVTQYDEPELRKRALDIGVVGYITKDNLYEINNFIKKYLPII